MPSIVEKVEISLHLNSHISPNGSDYGIMAVVKVKQGEVKRLERRVYYQKKLKRAAKDLGQDVVALLKDKATDFTHLIISIPEAVADYQVTAGQQRAFIKSLKKSLKKKFNSILETSKEDDSKVEYRRMDRARNVEW